MTQTSIAQEKRNRRAQDQRSNYKLTRTQVDGQQAVRVENVTTERVYHVVRVPGTRPSCDCIDAQRHPETCCKHAVLVTTWLQEQRAERQRRVTAALEVALAA